MKFQNFYIKKKRIELKKISINKNQYIYIVELFLILLISILVHSVAHFYNLCEKFNFFLKTHNYLNLEELFFSSILVLCGLIIFSIRRYLELRKETAVTSITKIKLQNEVSERTESENALKNSEKKYRELIEQSVEAIYLQENGRYEIVNNKFLELFKITHEDINSENFTLLDYTHPKSIASMKARMHKVQTGEKVSGMYEFTAITKDKKEIELEASISYIYTDGKIKTQGILRDISKRKRAESIQSAIYMISDATNMTNHLEELIANIHTILKSIIYAPNFYVALYDDKTDTFTSPYFADQFDTLDGKPMNLQGSLTDFIRRTEKAAIIDENKHLALVEAGEAKFILKPAKVWMGAPLKTSVGVFGVVAVQSYESPESYSQEDLELLSLISDQIAIAIEKKKTQDEKEKNRKFFETLIDSLSNPLYVINVDDYTIAAANNAAKELIFKHNLSDNRCYKLIHNIGKPCDSPSHPCSIGHLVKTKRPIKFENVIKNDNGIDVTYEVHVFPIFDDKGEVIQIIENYIDITERKKIEKKLIALAVFPEANPNIVMSINRKQDILYMNKATTVVLRELGISKDNIQHCFPKNIDELIETMLSAGSGMQDVLVKVNESSLAWTFHPVTGQDVIHCYAHNITQQVQQADEINKLSMVATQSSNIITITDLDGVIEYVNPYFTLVAGFEKEEIVGEKISKFKSGNMKNELYEGLWRSISNGIKWTGKIENKKKNGELYWESKTISPIVNADGKITSYISIGTDITNEIQMQRQLVESEKFSAIATLAAGVAHEFKNYLGGIIGNASFSLDEIDSEEGLSLAKETLTKIIDMGEKANDVAMALLTFSKAKSEDRKKEDLKKIITQSVKLIEKELGTLSIEIATHFDDVPPVEVSLSKIQQLLLNLFINAKHAIGTNGVITVTLINKGDVVEIKIGDSGGGINKDNLDKIFDPFFSTKGVWGEEKVSGTGMGLSICRNIAREHNGDLRVDTVLGVGSVFTISIPMSKESNISDITVYKNDKIKGQNIIFFTLNHSIVTNYYEDICKNNFHILLVDNFDKIDKTIINTAALVVCDAKFSAKLELYRLVEFCIENNQPYVMVNCGTMEYQLSDIYENAVANYKEFPDFYKMMQNYVSVSPEITSNQ